MTDIFREVEEEVRRERFEKLWKQYGDYIIAGAALVVIAAAGFQLWRVYEKRQTVTASETYAIAEQLLQQGQAGAAATTFSKLAENAPSGYAQLALLDKANALYASGNVPEAVEIYKQVAAKGNALLAPVARIRAAWASVDTVVALRHRSAATAAERLFECVASHGARDSCLCGFSRGRHVEGAERISGHRKGPRIAGSRAPARGCNGDLSHGRRRCEFRHGSPSAV